MLIEHLPYINTDLFSFFSKSTAFSSFILTIHFYFSYPIALLVEVSLF